MYKITIEKTEFINQKIKEWKKIADSGNIKDGGAIYDYVSTEEIVEKKQDILIQEVETLNIESVIRAINGI